MLSFIGSDENYSAFRKHLEEEGGIYGPLVILNLVEKTGKEKVLGDAYLSNILKHNNPEVSYYTFDFHEHWCVMFTFIFDIINFEIRMLMLLSALL